MCSLQQFRIYIPIHGSGARRLIPFPSGSVTRTGTNPTFWRIKSPGQVTALLDWECAGFKPLWSDGFQRLWFNDDLRRFICRIYHPESCGGDESAAKVRIRVFFRTELHRSEPDLFAACLGGVEMQCLVDSSADDEWECNETLHWLCNYDYEKCWNTARHGPFPWDYEK